MKDNKKQCGGCLDFKVLTNYYYSSSYANRGTETVHLCKDCIFDYAKGDNTPEDMQKVKDILRMIDKPFIDSIWKNSTKEAESKDWNNFRTYMKNIAMPHNKNKSWEDSIFKESVNISKSNESDSEELIDEVELKKFRKMWGKGPSKEGFSVDDYLYMQELYDNYMAKFPTTSPAQINIYKSIAKTHLKADKKLEDDEIKEWKDLMDVSSKMHNDAKIKAVQTGAIGEDRGLNTYGLWLSDIENDEPAEFFDKRPLFTDHDKIGKDWKRFILRPLTNLFTKQRDFDVGDD